jgi:hypothetical protein
MVGGGTTMLLDRSVMHGIEAKVATMADAVGGHYGSWEANVAEPRIDKGNAGVIAPGSWRQGFLAPATVAWRTTW